MKLRDNDMKQSLVSIVIPVYNVEPYLRECLDSVVGQSYKNLEILIVDDASTDGSYDICREYAKNDERIHLFKNEVNRGLSATRNLALDNAHGDYIGFVDSDDFIDPNMYDIMVKKLEADNADMAMCNYYWTNEAGEKTSNYVSHNQDRKVKGIEKLRENALTVNNCVWNKLFKKKLFEDIRFPEGRLFEDIFIIHEIIDKASSVSVTKESLYYYRRRNTAITLRSFKPENFDIVDAFIAKYTYVSEKYPDEKRMIKKVAESVISNMIYCVERVVAEDKLDDEFKALIKEKAARIDSLEIDLSALNENLVKKYALIQKDVRLYAFMIGRRKSALIKKIQQKQS